MHSPSEQVSRTQCLICAAETGTGTSAAVHCCTGVRVGTGLLVPRVRATLHCQKIAKPEIAICRDQRHFEKNSVVSSDFVSQQDLVNYLEKVSRFLFT